MSDNGFSKDELESTIETLSYPKLKMNWAQRCDDSPTRYITNEIPMEYRMKGHTDKMIGWKFETHFPFGVPFHREDELQDQQQLFELVKLEELINIEPHESIYLNNHQIFFYTVYFGDPRTEESKIQVKARRNDLFNSIMSAVKRINEIILEQEENDKNLLRDEFLS